ncbi:ankyrin [Fusarium mundagurra]|uniref:Ankyrin n=1 Tax=Fusarium mundagurra TaxID=1567541 RepID=A0A8H6D2T9_9HYPO|nr:ankyrin [Fusarium mundagurra]
MKEDMGSELVQAACAGKYDDVKALLERGDIDIDHLYNGKTALEESILNLEEPTALLLIENDASLRFKDGTNALYSASRCGLIKVAKAAIKKGWNVNKRPRGKTYPIQCAVESGNIKMVIFLLEKGAEINKFQLYRLSKDQDSENPFTKAWAEQRYDIFIELLDACLSRMCQKAKNKYKALLLPSQKEDPRDKLADRLILWLEWEEFLPTLDLREEYNSPETLILVTLERVFGQRCRGEPRIVEILIKKRVHLPLHIDMFLNEQVSTISYQPSTLVREMEIQPNMLDIIFAALPMIKKGYLEESWIITIVSTLSKRGSPFTLDNVKSELGNIFLQESVPSFIHLQILKGSSWLTTES